MKFVIQRVSEASVKVEGEVIGQIGKGFMVLIGVGQEDTKEIADKMVKKLVGLRIFEDENRIASLMLESGKQVFDKTCRPHDHLICTTCQKVFDVDMPYDRSIERKAENQLHIPIESHSLVLYGTCADCLQKKGKV